MSRAGSPEVARYAVPWETRGDMGLREVGLAWFPGPGSEKMLGSEGCFRTCGTQRGPWARF